MSRVRDLVTWIAPKRDDEGHGEGNGDALEGLKVEAAGAALRPPDHRPTDAGPLGKLALRPLAACAGRPNVAAQPSPPFAPSPFRFRDQHRPSPPHGRFLAG
jgi:hypothetical protein